MRNFSTSSLLFVSAVLAATTLAFGASAADEKNNEAGDVAPTVFQPVGAPEVAGEILVDMKDEASAADIAAVESMYGIKLRANSPRSGALGKFEVTDVDAASEGGLIARLSADARVEHAEPMEIFEATFVPNDPLYDAKQWHLKRVGAEQAWDYACGQGVTVAVVDTGVACYDKGPFSRGTDLSGTRCGGGYNFVDDSEEAVDDQGHGTHVAGTIAQTTNNDKGVAGLAFCANLMPVKVLNKYGWGTLADVAEGIRYAADNGASVINLSLGGSSPSKVLEAAVDHAIGKGVIVVAAAGNSGKSVGYPAAYDGVIAVSASDSNDNIAWFSSRGRQVAIAAPGVGVTQQTICEGGKNKCELFGTFNGTSMASPHVAGAAAMLVGLGVGDPEAVREELQGTARPKDDATLYGAGILDVGAGAAHVFYKHLSLRFLACLALFFAVARRIKQKGGKVRMSQGVVMGAIFTSVGLLPFAPLLNLASRAGSLRWIVELGMRPFGEWDLVYSAGLHRWLLLASALPSVAFLALLFGVKKVRGFMGGFAVGGAALLTQIFLSADVAFPLGSLALRVFCIVNVIACLWIARISLDETART
ncbi:MAG: S8 family peptidase [Polyangiaceae bacterium]